jgi:hypothetical protein
MKLILDCKDCGANLETCKCTDDTFNFSTLNTREGLNEHHTKLRTDPLYKAAYAAHREELRKESWNALKPFSTESDVPPLPNPLTPFYTERLIQLGAIPLIDLVDGQWYYGNYRNAVLGRWDNDKKVFHHLRYKFGYCWDTCNHFENDDRFALFVPLRIATDDEVKTEIALAPANI